MINPLKVATSGYLKRTTKAALIIAVAGYLNYGDGPIVSHDNGGGSDVIERKENNDGVKYNMAVDDANLISIFKIYIEWL